MKHPMTNARYIAIPPINAVGLVCQRSLRGAATILNRWAPYRTRNVNIKLSAAVTATPTPSLAIVSPRGTEINRLRLAGLQNHRREIAALMAGVSEAHAAACDAANSERW